MAPTYLANFPITSTIVEESLKLPYECGPSISNHTKQHCRNKRSMITPEAWTPVSINSQCSSIKWIERSTKYVLPRIQVCMYVCMYVRYITAFASISSLVVQNVALLFAVNRSLTWTLDHRCGRWKLKAAEKSFFVQKATFSLTKSLKASDGNTNSRQLKSYVSQNICSNSWNFTVNWCFG